MSYKSSSSIDISAANLTESRAYLMMKTSLSLFELNPEKLDSHQCEELARVVGKTEAIQQRVLASAEAKQVHIEQHQLDKAIELVRQSFNSEDEFRTALTANQISVDGLRLAVANELINDAVLAYVSKDIDPVSVQQAQDYYQQHIDKFTQVARCEAHHLLITINPQFKENTATQAKIRIGKLANTVNADNFEHLAERHSECPTAVNGGYLGLVEAGQLLPELNQALFAMNDHSFSQPILSEMGYHLLWCKQHVGEHQVPFEHAKEKIQQALFQHACKQRQRQWLAKICQSEPLN